MLILFSQKHIAPQAFHWPIHLCSAFYLQAFTACVPSWLHSSQPAAVLLPATYSITQAIYYVPFPFYHV